jgi:hypothetical protein
MVAFHAFEWWLSARLNGGLARVQMVDFMRLLTGIFIGFLRV